MTEPEAKAKTCPLSLNNPGGAMYCQGDGCMWWRWTNQHAKPPIKRVELDSAKELEAIPAPVGTKWMPVARNAWGLYRRHGHCAKAPPLDD
jgi:hypothetical protein